MIHGQRNPLTVHGLHMRMSAGPFWREQHSAHGHNGIFLSLCLSLSSISQQSGVRHPARIDPGQVSASHDFH